MRQIKNTSVCVVGGAGFLGSHLVNYLVEERNCHVLVLDNLCVGQRYFVHPRAEFYHHDITDSEEFMYKLFRKHAVNYVFNYAAWPYIPDSFERPLQVFNVNANGAIKVINAAHGASVQGILQVSSAELYGKAEGSGITEQSPVSPRSTYGAAKAAVDYYCQAAWRERQTPVIALRQFNCLGERETHPYIVPEIISQLSAKRNEGTVTLGNNTERDFLYAGDQVRIAVELLEKGDFGEVYNLGSEHSITVHNLACLIGRVMNKEVRIITSEARKRPWEIWYLKSNNNKLYRKVTARPLVSLEEAIHRTVEDFRANGWSWVKS